MNEPAKPARQIEPRAEHQSEDGSDRLRRTVEETRDAAAERARELGDEARRVAGRAADEAKAGAERAKSDGAGRLRDLSRALNRAADDLGEDSPSGMLVRKAAGGLDDVAGSIDRQSIGDMVETVSDFGRRNPAVFIGGLALAGFALSRFATASRPRGRHGDRHDFDRHFDYDRPVTGGADRAAGSQRTAGREPASSGSAHAARPAPGTSAPAAGEPGERLTLEPSMRRPGEDGGSSAHDPANGGNRS